MINLFNLFKKRQLDIFNDPRVLDIEINGYGEIIKIKLQRGLILKHKNGDKTDFSPSNLEIITRAENLKRNRAGIK